MNNLQASEIDALSDDVKEQIKILETSEFYILLIIFGIVMSLNNVELQKNQLICSALNGEECGCPELFPLKITSSTIILAALFFFYELSCKGVKDTNGEDFSANTNFSASTLTLGAVIIRIIDLIKSQQKKT